MTTIVGCLSAPTTGAFTSFIRSSRLPRQTYPFESPLWTPQFNWFPVTKAIKLERHSTALTSYIDLYIYCLPICGLAYIHFPIRIVASRFIIDCTCTDARRPSNLHLKCLGQTLFLFCHYGNAKSPSTNQTMGSSLNCEVQIIWGCL